MKNKWEKAIIIFHLFFILWYYGKNEKGDLYMNQSILHFFNDMVHKSALADGVAQFLIQASFFLSEPVNKLYTAVERRVFPFLSV